MEKSNLVMHEDHPAICICCVNCRYDESIRGYSEWTPGEPMSLTCAKEHPLKINGYSQGYEWHDGLMLAQNCKDFEGSRRLR